jgi:hypothetical protein
MAKRRFPLYLSSYTLGLAFGLVLPVVDWLASGALEPAKEAEKTGKESFGRTTKEKDLSRCEKNIVDSLLPLKRDVWSKTLGILKMGGWTRLTILRSTRDQVTCAPLLRNSLAVSP